eukprot:Nk52_evm14s263 gene=Nk52_evmTU14s263
MGGGNNNTTNNNNQPNQNNQNPSSFAAAALSSSSQQPHLVNPSSPPPNLPSRGLPPQIGSSHSVVDLQNDLNITLSLITKLRMENETFKCNFETLKSAHVQLSSSNEDLKERHGQLMEEFRSREQELETKISKLRAENDIKDAKISDMRQHIMSPKEIEMLRVQILEELEIPHRQKCETLLKDMEQYRSCFFQLRRDHELLKTVHEQQLLETKGHISEIMCIHSSQVRDLKQQISDLQNEKTSANESGDVRNMRLLQRDNQEMQVKMQNLLTELSEVRASKEQNNVQTEQARMLHARQLSEAKSHVKEAESELDSLRQANKRAMNEAETYRKESVDFQHQIEELEREVSDLRAKSEDTVHNFNIEYSQLKMDFLEAKNELEAEVRACQQHIETDKFQIEELQGTIHDLQMKMEEQEKESVARVHQAREEEWKKIRLVEDQKCELEAQLNSLQATKISSEEQLSSRLRELNEEKAELESKLAQVDHSRVEVDRNRKELLEKRDEQEQALNELSSMQKNLVELEGKMVVCAREKELCENSLVRTEERLVLLERERHKWVGEKEKLTKEREQLKEQNMQERKELEEGIASIKSSYDELFNAAKKVKASYKKKLGKLMDKLELQKAQIEQNELEKNAVRQALEQDHLNTKQRLKDMQRKHDEFKFLLNTESRVLDNSMQQNTSMSHPPPAGTVGVAGIGNGNFISSGAAPTPGGLFSAATAANNVDLSGMMAMLDTGIGLNSGASAGLGGLAGATGAAISSGGGSGTGGGGNFASYLSKVEAEEGV